MYDLPVGDYSNRLQYIMLIYYILQAFSLGKDKEAAQVTARVF